MKFRYLAGYCASFLALYRKIHFFGGEINDFGCVRALIYHNIPENKIAHFKRQICYLASIYHFLTPFQFEEFVQGRYSCSGINLLLTFDDGFKSNRIVEEKVLKPLNIKGIFFVPTEFIDLRDVNKQKKFVVQQIYKGDANNSEITSDMEPLTWEDLEYLLSQGHVIGSHSRTHKCLSLANPQDELHNEIVESGNILEKKLGVPIPYFAYPFGDIDSISKYAMDLIKERYKYCFSGIRGANYFPVSNYAILRDSISTDASLQYIRLIMESGLDIIYRRKMRKLLELTRD